MATNVNNQNIFTTQQIINNATAPANGQYPTMAYALQTLLQPGMYVEVNVNRGYGVTPYVYVSHTAKTLTLCPCGYDFTPANYVRRTITPAVLSWQVNVIGTKQQVNAIANQLAVLAKNPYFVGLNGNFLPLANYIVGNLAQEYCCAQPTDCALALAAVWEWQGYTCPVPTGANYPAEYATANTVLKQVLTVYVP